MTNHPEVIHGQKSERDVFMEFMSLWNHQDKDAPVSKEEFCDYHCDISGLIESDEHFTQYMNDSWKL